MNVIITAHATLRYQQRIAPHLSLDQAREAIRASAATILIAHDFGCHAVLTSAGAKLVLQEGVEACPTVTTVVHAHREQRTSVPRKMIKRFGKLRRGWGR